MAIAGYIKRSIKGYLRELLTIWLADFKVKPPLLIYQMGKVGSSSVYKTLNNNITDYSLYHVHVLSSRGISNARNIFKEKGLIYAHENIALRYSAALRRKLLANRPHVKIITLVREPISRCISDTFQNLHFYMQQEHRNQYDYDSILNVVKQRLNDYNPDRAWESNWFDKEIRDVFGVDVYDYPFDKDRRYGVINSNNADILILRTENLASSVKPISEFLGKELTSLVGANIASEKIYSDVYARIKKDLVVPDNICQKVYGSRYVRHFYSDDDIKKFMLRWSGHPDNESG